jgi:hypothetical protein
VRILPHRLAAVTGHRVGHPPPRVPIEMICSVIGNDGAGVKARPSWWLVSSLCPTVSPSWVPRRLARMAAVLLAHRTPARPGVARRLVPLLATMVVLSGCHLLDQTDFQPKRPAPPVVPPVPDPETRAALLTIDFARPDTDYRSAVAAAIHVVEARRPGVLYDVVGVVQDIAGVPDGRARAAEVMTAIEAAGVNPARIQLGVTLDTARKIPQVRVYLR